MDSICKFKTLKSRSESKMFKNIIISLVLFRPFKRNHKPESYKFGLLKTLENVTKYRPDWIVRLYIDESLYSQELSVPQHIQEKDNIWIPLLDKIGKYDNLEIINFKAPNFMENDGIHHKGYFSTLVRMFPIFMQTDDIILVRDTDGFAQKKDMEIIEDWIETDYGVHFYIDPCYSAKHLYQFWPKYKLPTYENSTYKFMIKLPVAFDAISFKIKFNPEHMINFLNNNTFWDFGVDELYLNFYFKPYIFDNNVKLAYNVFYYGFSPYFGRIFSPRFIYQNISSEKLIIRQFFLEKMLGLPQDDLNSKIITTDQVINKYDQVINKLETLEEKYIEHEHLNEDDIDTCKKILDFTKLLVKKLDRKEIRQNYYDCFVAMMTKIVEKNEVLISSQVLGYYNSSQISEMSSRNFL